VKKSLLTSLFLSAFLSTSLSIFMTTSIAMPSNSYAAAFLADLTLSPVKTVLEIVVSPTATSFAGTLATADRPADRQQVLNAVGSDAADHLSGADKTPLLNEVHSMLRSELARRGDTKNYSDLDLSRMIAAEISEF
jgi:hypothetical protein